MRYVEGMDNDRKRRLILGVVVALVLVAHSAYMAFVYFG
jgi:tetrahydromethanopterin S-methyltransferase subunit F